IVQLGRRKKEILDERGIQKKFGVRPESIPDYLALVGDSADGYPGLPGWGAKSTAAVLHRYVHLEDIPDYGHRWDVDVRGATKLAAVLTEQRDLAFLFRDLATLRADADLLDEGSFVELDLLASTRSSALDQKLYTDGVITGWGTVDGRQVFIFSQDFTVFGGSLGEVYGEKIHKLMDMALKVGAPVVGLNDG